MLEIISTTPVNQENEGKRRFIAAKRGVAKMAARFARPQHLSSQISGYAPVYHASLREITVLNVGHWFIQHFLS